MKSTSKQAERLKIEISGGEYYQNIWLTLEDGGSGSWTYVCREGLTYIFIKIMDMVDACGKDIIGDDSIHATVSTVDLFNASPENIGDALRCIGYEDELNMLEERDRLIVAQAMMEYGNHSPLEQFSGRPVTEKNLWDGFNEDNPYFRKVRAEARRFAETLFDEETRNELLDTKVVNAIGQTAREFAGGIGSLWNSLRKIRDNPEATDEQKLLLGLYQKAERTLGGQKIPEDLRENESASG